MLQSLQSVKEQQAISSHLTRLFISLSLQFYRGITVGIAPHPHGNSVRHDPIPTVLP